MTREEGAEVLDLWLERTARTLQPAQRDEVLGRFAAHGLPLYLRLAFEEARWWHSYSEPARTVLRDSIAELITDNLFARLALPANHGRLLVSHALGYLAASRHGLSEDELLALLSADDEVRRGLPGPLPEVAGGGSTAGDRLVAPVLRPRAVPVGARRRRHDPARLLPRPAARGSGRRVPRRRGGTQAPRRAGRLLPPPVRPGARADLGGRLSARDWASSPTTSPKRTGSTSCTRRSPTSASSSTRRPRSASPGIRAPTGRRR